LAQRLRPNDFQSAVRTLVLVVAVVAVTALGKFLVFRLAEANAGFTIYIPAVAVAAWNRGLLAGVLATLLSALVDTLVFLPPTEVVLAQIRDQQIRLLAYLAGGFVASYISNLLRTERDHARRQAQESRKALADAAAARSELDRVVTLERRANELRDAFNSIISHELRTPITAIYGGAKLLASRDRNLDTKARNELIHDLEAESDRLYRLVEDLLILSKSERGTVERASEPVLIPRIVTRIVRSEHDRWPDTRFAVHWATAYRPLVAKRPTSNRCCATCLVMRRSTAPCVPRST
jgi:K+-sensing histidine kinase KdpD